MSRVWCANFPQVSVPRSATPRLVTFVYPFYENPAFLRRQIDGWQTYPADLRAQLRAIVVDDGSPTPAVLPDDLPFPIRLFRIAVDVRWNWLAARNIGAHHAREGWCCFSDMDHVIPEATVSSLVYGSHDSGVIYGFSRIEHTGAPINPHPNSWFLTRSMFWKIGGYDETLSGHYGTDGDWRRRCAATAPIHILRDQLIRHEYVGDSSTTRYQRKQPQDQAVRRIVAARTPGWRPKVLSFPYEEQTPVCP